MKAKLIHRGKGFQGYMEDEVTYEKVKYGASYFNHKEQITHYVIPASVFERLIDLDRRLEHTEPCPICDKFLDVDNLANELAKKGVKMPNTWISVKDKMPEKNQRVLCVFLEDHGIQIVCENTYEGDDIWSDDTSKVTHWMPMPEMPEVKS